MKLITDATLNPRPATFGGLDNGDVFWHKCIGVCLKCKNTRLPSTDPLHVFAVNMVDGRVEPLEATAIVHPLKAELHHGNHKIL
jgi:hypothetical protein